MYQQNGPHPQLACTGTQSHTVTINTILINTSLTFTSTETAPVLVKRTSWHDVTQNQLLPPGTGDYLKVDMASGLQMPISFAYVPATLEAKGSGARHILARKRAAIFRKATNSE